MKKLSIVVVLFALAINTAQAFNSYEDYVEYDRARTRYDQERFDRMMENSRRSSAVDAMYSVQQQTYYPTNYNSDDSYKYYATQTISKPLEVFGRY